MATISIGPYVIRLTKNEAFTLGPGTQLYLTNVPKHMRDEIMEIELNDGDIPCSIEIDSAMVKSWEGLVVIKEVKQFGEKYDMVIIFYNPSLVEVH